MKKEELIPELSSNISFHEFSATECFIHQKEFGYRIKISNHLRGILNQIDGKKTLKDIINDSNETIDVVFLHDVLYTKLGKYGIIKNNDIEVSYQAKPSYLKLSFIVIPPKVISYVTPYLKSLFKPQVMRFFIILGLCIIVIGLWKNFDLIMNQKLDDIWFGLFILGFTSVTFHEFGHVTAAEYFGAEHGGIGGGFYLFSPVYFADVTDIWKLRPKERIIVNVAGIYFEVVICSIFIIIGYLFGSPLMYISGLVIFIKTLFNLNPFMRSDGYWVLTDFLGIPNLYKESSQKLKEIVKSLFSKKKNSFRLKTYMLALYASINFFTILMFLYFVIFIDSNSILYFPINAYNFVLDIFNSRQSLSLDNLAQFFIPILFYYLLFNLIKSLYKKYLLQK